MGRNGVFYKRGFRGFTFLIECVNIFTLGESGLIENYRIQNGWLNAPI